MSTATFTELLRHPNDVIAQTEQGAVRITRRDAEDLMLLRADELEGRDQGIAMASRIMRAVLANKGNMVAALQDAFAWTALLSSAGKRQFAQEIDTLIWSATELGAYGRLTNTIMSWQGTAEAIAEGLEPIADSDILPTSEWLTVEKP